YVLVSVDATPDELRGLGRDAARSRFDIEAWVVANLKENVAAPVRLRAMRAAGLLAPERAVGLLKTTVLATRDTALLNTLCTTYEVAQDRFRGYPLALIDLAEAVVQKSEALDFGRFPNPMSNTAYEELEWVSCSISELGRAANAYALNPDSRDPASQRAS